MTTLKSVLLSIVLAAVMKASRTRVLVSLFCSIAVMSVTRLSVSDEMTDRGLRQIMIDTAARKKEEGTLQEWRVFDSMTVNDSKPMSDFSPAEASAFAKRVNKAIKARR